MIQTLTAMSNPAKKGEASGGPASSTDFTLGYVVHSRTDEHFVGGMLVIDLDGDPLEFCHSDAVNVNRFTKILLGEHLESYLLSRVIGPALLRTIELKPDIILFEEPTLLLRQFSLGQLQAVLAPQDVPHKSGRWERLNVAQSDNNGRAWWAPRGLSDEVERFLLRAREGMEPRALEEPFQRLREALEQVGQSTAKL